MMDEGDSDLLTSIRTLAFAGDRFEPFPQAMVDGTVLQRLVEYGFVEAGRSCRPAVAATGYRLTRRGWELARQRWTRRNTALSEVALDEVA